MYNKLISFIRDEYESNETIPLHSPTFIGQEQEYVADTIKSSYVSSVGKYVELFERNIENYTKSNGAVATVNGTSALHISLIMAGVTRNDFVITQPITFVATCNAISYCGAEPIFVDVDECNLGLSPTAMSNWLNDNAFIDKNGLCRTKLEKRIIRACLPMHTFGHPADVDGLLLVCNKWNLLLIEDAAESLGSLYKGRHTGTFGIAGIISFNGNKIVTTGGGGIVLAEKEVADRIRHLTTTAKIPHRFEYFHNEVGYNYRMPNINAALGCAQLEQLERFIILKRNLASRYEYFFKNSEFKFITEPNECRSNYWLNAVVCPDSSIKDRLLDETNKAGVTTRPIWRLMNDLPMYSGCKCGPLNNAEWLTRRLVNLPSGVALKNV